jgi:hypothetical protein
MANGEFWRTGCSSVAATSGRTNVYSLKAGPRKNGVRAALRYPSSRWARHIPGSTATKQVSIAQRTRTRFRSKVLSVAT